MKLSTTLLILGSLFIISKTSYAQERSFKLGVNRTKFLGKSEKDASGNKLENYNQEYGFTAALMTEVPFDDESGIRFEMTYTRKNFKWNYSGQSFIILDTEGGNTVVATGKKTSDLKVKAYFFELPIMLYQRFESGLEVAGGLNLGLSIGTNGTGTMTFDGTTSNGTKLPAFTTTLNYRYNQDKTTTVEYSNLTYNIGSETVKIPKSMGAYYETRTKTGNPFNRFDVGVNADIAYWLNEKFGIRMRANYNFLDRSSNTHSFQQQALDADKKVVSKNAYENMFNYQLTLDFRL